MSKIQIWKRITTLWIFLKYRRMLYLICQRYKFESESQRVITSPTLQLAVFNMSKIQIWKRITTTIGGESEIPLLYLICQRYKFESESQLPLEFLTNTSAVFNMSKIQIWKRITTGFQICIWFAKLYLICQRYKFESESQLASCWSITKYCCI